MNKELSKIMENLSKDKSGTPAFALACDSLELNIDGKNKKFSIVMR